MSVSEHLLPLAAAFHRLQQSDFRGCETLSCELKGLTVSCTTTLDWGLWEAAPEGDNNGCILLLTSKEQASKSSSLSCPASKHFASYALPSRMHICQTKKPFESLSLQNIYSIFASTVSTLLRQPFQSYRSFPNTIDMIYTPSSHLPKALCLEVISSVKF